MILKRLTNARKIDKVVLEGLPAFDLDSAVNVGIAFDELEGSVQDVGLKLKRFVRKLNSRKQIKASKLVHASPTQLLCMRPCLDAVNAGLLDIGIQWLLDKK